MGKKISVWDLEESLVVHGPEKVSETFEHASDSEIPYVLKSMMKLLDKAF